MQQAMTISTETARVSTSVTVRSQAERVVDLRARPLADQRRIQHLDFFLGRFGFDCRAIADVLGGAARASTKVPLTLTCTLLTTTPRCAASR